MAAPFHHTQGTELRDYLTVLRRRVRLIVAVAVLVSVSAVIFSLTQEEVYASKGRLLVARGQSIFVTAESPADPEFAETEIELVESEAVRSLVREKLPSAPEVSAVQVGSTSVIELSTESSSPEAAAASTAAYMDAYLEFRRRQATEASAATRRELQATVEGLQARLDDVSNQLRSVECPATGDCPARAALEQDREARLTELIPFRQRLAQVNLDASAANVGAVVSAAAVPDDPVRPTPLRNGALALALGLVLGVALALAADYLDDTVREDQDIERALPGLPILALIPPAPDHRRQGHAAAADFLDDSTSPSAEAYRCLRVAVRSLALDPPLRWLQVTSATDSEGKTTTAANLGLVLSRAGEQVIIVSWDLRRPRVHEHFGISNDVGLTSVLLGDITLSKALQPVTDDQRLWVLPAGPVPPNAADLLSSAEAQDLLAELRAEPVTVVFDCPPVLPVADATILAEQVDGTILVAREGFTSRRKMARSIGVLRQAGAPILGSVLHVISMKNEYRYGYNSEGPEMRRMTGSSVPTAAVPTVAVPMASDGGSVHDGDGHLLPQSQNGPVRRAAPQPGAAGFAADERG